MFKGFHRFLQVRKAAEIEAAFGVRLDCPLDEFNAARHVSDDSPNSDAPAARDYALFRTLYHAGLRSEEVVMLDRSDVHFGRGTFGKLHVRFGKGAKGVRAATAVGPDAGWAGSGVALVSRRRPRSVPG